MNTKIVITVLFSLLSISVYSTDLEEYFGKYQSVNSKDKMSFILNERGVLNLSIDKIDIDLNSLTYDYLGIYGGTLVFQIKFDDNKKYSNIIQLFIVKIEEEIVIVTGYHIQYKTNNEYKITDIKKQTLVLSYKKFPYAGRSVQIMR